MLTSQQSNRNKSIKNGFQKAERVQHMYTHAVARDLVESWQSVSIMCTGWGAVCQHFHPTRASSTQQSQHDTEELLH